MNLRNQLQIFGIVEFDGVPVFEPILIANGHHNSMKLKYLKRQARIARAKYIRVQYHKEHGKARYIFRCITDTETYLELGSGKFAYDAVRRWCRLGGGR